MLSGTEWLDECARVHEAGQRSGILLEEGKVKVFRVIEIDDLPNGTIRDVAM